jgi:glycosyltransferase involved in cell wall biosynthesis
VQSDVPDAGRARLAIVGDGPLMAELRALAEALGIAGRTWFSGAIANVRDVLQTFDVFVLPSLNEGISNTILEAMATGLPIIATAVGGNVELVEEGTNGRLVEVDDVAELTQALTEFLSSAQRRREYGMRARETAVARFSLDRMVSQYRAVYEELLGDSPPP